MLHQRRVPFLLVSWKCSTHWAHLRTRLRSTLANKVAALSASGANRSSGLRVWNQCVIDEVFPVTLSRERIGWSAIHRFSPVTVERRTELPPSHARTSFLRLSRS